MLVYKAAQVVAIVKEEPKPWKMNDREGVTHSAKVACIGAAADAESIKIKAKSGPELDAKLAKYPVGKPAEIPVLEIIPLTRAGQDKPSSYEFIG